MNELATRTPVEFMIPAAALELVEASVSLNTRRVYSSVWRRFDATGLEANDAGIAAYLIGLFESGRSPATASLAVAALRFRARHAGDPDPVGPLSERVLAGFRRAAANRGWGQVTGIRFEEARAVARQAAKDGQGRTRATSLERRVAGLRDAALIAVASDALLRVSEVAALEVGDIDWGSSTLLVRRSKTDQEGEGAALYLGKPTLKRIRVWLEAAGIEAGPLFRPVTRGGLVTKAALTPRSVRRIIKARAEAAGVEGRVSGHSLRVGTAQSLAARGATVIEMQQAGRWQSPAMPGHYARAELAGRGAVARLLYRISGIIGHEEG